MVVFYLSVWSVSNQELWTEIFADWAPLPPPVSSDESVVSLASSSPDFSWQVSIISHWMHLSEI
jgi:hypothetical protein